MDASNWYQFYSFVNRVARYIGHSEVQSVDYGTLQKSVLVSPDAFERLSRGRTIEQAMSDGFNVRSFKAGGFIVRTAIPYRQPAFSQAMGEPLDLERWCVAEAATDESVLCDEDHSDDDTVLSGEIPASDSDAAVMESSL